MSTTDILLTQKRKLTEELERLHARAETIQAEIAALETALKVMPQGETKPQPVKMAEAGRKMSVKAMVLDALEKHYPQGATALDLLDCFAKAYERDDVARTSLSPQLTTLKNDGKISRDGMHWHLVRHG